MEAWCHCPLSEVKEWGGFDGDGEEYSFSPETVLKNIKESGCWGFSGNKNSIHVWFDANCDMGDLVHLFAHERGHILRPHKRSDDKEEIKAETYGDTARFAYDVANSLLNQKLKGEKQ